MREISFIIDRLKGTVLVEDNQSLTTKVREQITAHLGAGQETGCARPLAVLPPEGLAEEKANGVFVRINGYYHDSLCEGPGRRSSVLFQGCPLQCKSCWVPQLHSNAGGASVSAARLAEELLDPNFERDGVTILGGEPFAQAPGLLALVRELRTKNCPHIVCYSGYTLEALREKAARQPAIGEVLNEIDVLIDGAYVESLSSGAGLWTGSGNQRVIDLQATGDAGKIVLYS